MSTETPSSNGSMPPSAEKPNTLVSSPLPQTPTPTSRKRKAPCYSSPIPPKVQILNNFRPEPSTPCEHDFWITVWHNGDRVSKASTIATYTALAVYKSVGHEVICRVQENKTMSTIYDDDPLWFKVTLSLPPRAAAELLTTTSVESISAVVIFAPFPCTTQVINVSDLEEWQEAPGNAGEFRARTVVKNGRPYTWSLKKSMSLNQSVARNKRGKVAAPPKNQLEEYIELNESLNTRVEEEEIN